MALRILLVFFAQFAALAVFADEPAPRKITNFALLDHAGVAHSLYYHRNSKFVVIMAHGNGCPIVQKYALKFSALRKKYEPKGAVFFALNASLLDGRASIAKEAEQYKYDVPILLDPSQIVSRELGMTRTAEVVVISTKDWKIKYRGPVDDSIGYEINKRAAQHNHLEDTLKQLLAGKKIPFRQVEAMGCSITYKKDDEISYTKDIFPIVQNKCMSCHAENKPYLPKLDSHRLLEGWASMMRETIFTDRMPPFSGDTHIREVNNDISLTPEEKRRLIQWIDAGLKTESSVDKNAPIPAPVETKQNGLKLIHTVSMSEDAKLPPEGPDEYLYYQLGEATERDMWVRSTNTVSTNPRLLHHQGIEILPKPLSYYFERTEKARGMPLTADGPRPLTMVVAMRDSIVGKTQARNLFRIGTWSVGRTQPIEMPSDTVAFVPKGSYLVLETHHMGTGKPETEKTTIEFYGYLSKPKNILWNKLNVAQLNIKIPPNKKSHIETGSVIASEDYHIHAFNVHLHMRGRSAKVLKTTPDGVTSVVVSVPNFYYGWMTGQVLEFKKPEFIPKGTKLTVVCEYDNSKNNPNNPDPNKTVYFGPRLDTSEMCLAALGITYDDQSK